jgi:hypothetical protein
MWRRKLGKNLVCAGQNEIECTDGRMSRYTFNNMFDFAFAFFTPFPIENKNYRGKKNKKFKFRQECRHL